MPPLTDADAPDDDGQYGGGYVRVHGGPGLPPGFGNHPGDPRYHYGRGDDDDDRGVIPAWPPLPQTMAEIPPVLGGPPRRCPATVLPGPPAGTGRRPAAGLLDLTISWGVLAGDPAAAATLGRLGPLSSRQALPIAVLAIADPAAQWRVIITGPGGHAIAVERVRRGQLCDNPGRPPGVTGRVTVTIPAAAIPAARAATSAASRGTGGGIHAAVLRAAARAAARAARAAAADTAAGGCAHTAATPAYRPPARIRELAEARDHTCRQPRCGQPAWRTDLDHTTPWHQGGRTCPCNTGSFCRTHHQVKQLPGWTITQPRPGTFHWTTPAGRTYTTTPHTYPT